MPTRDEVLAVAKSWIDTPWRHQASVKGVGADCVGLIRGTAIESRLIDIAAESRPDVAQFKGYGRKPFAGALERGCAMFLDPIAIEDARIADVFLMRFDGDPQHLAIVSSVFPLRVIHSYATARKVCENGIDGEWKQGVTWRSLIVSAWRFRGIE